MKTQGCSVLLNAGAQGMNLALKGAIQVSLCAIEVVTSEALCHDVMLNLLTGTDEAG